jgi:peptidoglycan/LPS O-acetylase OafA/YrhL
LLLFLPALIQVRTIRISIAVTCLYLGYGLLLITFIHRLPHGGIVERFKATWLARAIAAIGTFSYSIYLWHRDTSYKAYELARELTHSLGAPGEVIWTLQILAYVAASVLGGVVMGRLIEAPALRVRDKFFPSRTAAVQGAASAAPSPATVPVLDPLTPSP